MRYLLPTDRATELSARQEYLFDIFHVYFLKQSEKYGFITMIPFCSQQPDILFVTGHADQVEKYLMLERENIPESVIVLTTCFGRISRAILGKTGKEIYIPSNAGGLCWLRDGKPFGFDFDISDAELAFYNKKGTLEERLAAAYMQIT